MAPSSTLPDALLAQFRTAIFEQVSDEQFVRIGPLPHWLRTLWPDAETATGPVDLSEHFLFLASFLSEADPFWMGTVDLAQYPTNALGVPYLCSQAWAQEVPQGGEYLLEAVALRIPPSETSDMRALMLMRPASISYAEHRRILQEGRSLNLSFQHANQQLRTQRAAFEGLLHDAEDPLASLTDALLLLQHGSLTPDQQRVVSLAQQQVRALRSTLQEAETAHTPNQQPAPAEIPSLTRIVDEVVAHVQDRVPSPPCSVALKALPDDPAPVPMESERLRRVVIALIEHGMRRSPVDTTVQVQVDATDAHATVHVTDSGPSIPGAVRPHLFERNSAPTSSAPENDLTLYFARITVESSGGRIGYADTDRGPRIWVKLPTMRTG
ncbi:MAG: HAMP domain-containing sensor histidine kinase [Longimonas sp.]|uniref:sensor histidine kinase n=1 Tax=Longimonas sp. TaxID=2039626 RepID=UPI003976A440